MAIEVKVPSLGESITTGILANWHIGDGEYIEKEQVLYELETDKITSEGNAEVSGVVKLLVAEGDEVEIGQVIATIDDSAKPESAGGDKSEPEPEVKAEPEAEETETGREAGPASGGAGLEHSPAVKRVLHDTGVPAETVQGSGKGGRLTKGDVLAAAGSKGSETTSVSPAKQSAPVPVASEKRESRRKLSPLRRSIAARLVGAQSEAALLTTFNEVDMSAVMGLRKEHQEAFVEKYGVKLGFMSFFIKAVVHALEKVPALNARMEGEELVENHFYDIGVAVSTEKGLMVPVLRDCEKQSFGELESGLLAYAKKARDGKISIEDLQNGVFTITNGGVFGSLLSTPIVNAPQSGILGMHTIQERPVAVNGEVVIRPMMYLALTYDHRIVDGKEAVTFLVEVKKTIENPVRLLLDL
ncbi:MAG: 2-oxoglutarate dehydrogenase complex dihydrolipoyllysine-residue succinyltransferase [Puniceicoccaceae bacterium]